MNLVRFDPWKEMRHLESSMDRFFNDNFSSQCFDNTKVRTARGDSPAVDVYETENELVFTAELPGFKKGEIEISVHDGSLTIKAEREFAEGKDTKYHRVERWYGNCYRKLLLPTSVDPEKVKANLKDGLLTVTLPKKEEAKPRQIPVSVS